MTATDAACSRRALLRTTAGGAACVAVAGATGGASAQEGDGGEKPDFGGYLDDVGNYDGEVEDRTGQGEVDAVVGAEGNGGYFAFEPAAVHVDNGSTVVWEWTGDGGQHTVTHEDGEFGSELTAEEGFTFEQTFEEDGIYLYYCEPHKGLGMKGAVVVGEDYPTTSDGGGGNGSGGDEDETAGNETAAYTLIAMLTLGLLSPIVFAVLVRRRMGRGT